MKPANQLQNLRFVCDACVPTRRSTDSERVVGYSYLKRLMEESPVIRAEPRRGESQRNGIAAFSLRRFERIERQTP